MAVLTVLALLPCSRRQYTRNQLPIADSLRACLCVTIPSGDGVPLGAVGWVGIGWWDVAFSASRQHISRKEIKYLFSYLFPGPRTPMHAATHVKQARNTLPYSGSACVGGGRLVRPKPPLLYPLCCMLYAQAGKPLLSHPVLTRSWSALNLCTSRRVVWICAGARGCTMCRPGQGALARQGQARQGKARQTRSREALSGLSDPPLWSWRVRVDGCPDGWCRATE